MPSMTTKPRRTSIAVKLSLDYFYQLARRLRRNRIKRATLAREMGVNPEQVTRWLTRGRDPRISSVIAIEQALARILARRERKAAAEQAGSKTP